MLAAKRRWSSNRTAQELADEYSAHRSSVGIPLGLGNFPPKRFDGILSFLEVDLLPFRDWRFFREVGSPSRLLGRSADVEGRGSGAGVPRYRGGEWGGVADLKS